MLDMTSKKQRELVVIKDGIVDIMKQLNKDELVDTDTQKIFQFCIDQNVYKRENLQANGFDERAVIDTIDTLTEALGYSIISDTYREELESNMNY